MTDEIRQPGTPPGLLRRDDQVLWRSGPGPVAVVLPAGADAPLALSGPGAALWGAFDRPRTLDEVARHLSSTFGEDTERVRRDVEPVLAQLVEAGALRRVG